MNNAEMFLISEDVYLKHITDKVRLYQMVEYLTRQVKRLPNNRGTKELSQTAARFADASEDMFRTWGIPKSYCVTGAEEELYDLMDSELFPPDCDDGCCQMCECCQEAICDACVEQILGQMLQTMPHVFGFPSGSGKRYAMCHTPCCADPLVIYPEAENRAVEDIPVTQPVPDPNEEQQQILDDAMTTFTDVLRTIFGGAVQVEVCVA